MKASDYARDLFLKLAAINPSHVDDIANLMVATFEAAMGERCEQCVHRSDAEIDRARPLIEQAAAMADEAEEWDQINNGAAASGGAHGLGDRIRALLHGPADAVAS